MFLLINAVKNCHNSVVRHTRNIIIFDIFSYFLMTPFFDEYLRFSLQIT